MDRNQILNDNEQALRLAFDGRLSNLWTAGPGIVQAIDFTTMTLSVQPAIQGVVENEDGTVINVNMPLLIHVPIQFPAAGGFALTLPIQVGDEVLIVWASRCIDAWWQSGGIQRPIEARLHDLSDGFALVGIKSVPNVIPSISTTGAQLRNTAGTTYVEIAADGKIKLVSPSEIDITAPVVSVTGDMNVSGAVAAGSLSAPTATIGGIPFATHRHTGVQTGGGDTGGPI